MRDLSKETIVERITTVGENFFFGYYDLSPESPDGTKVLACRTRFIDRMPTIEDPLELGYYVLGTPQFHKIGETFAWNFQEGCRLQWIDDSHIIYNDRNDRHFCSKMFDINQKKVTRTYDIPIYSISKNRHLATTYGFVNNKYSYAHTVEEKERDEFGDGVYVLNLDTGEYKLILPVEELSERAGSIECHNWVEYCTISPDGNSFFLIHRWEKNGILLGNQLCKAGFDGDFDILLNSKFISHTGWRGDDELSAWARLPGGINKIQENKFLENTGLFRLARDVYHIFVKSQSVRQRFTNDAYILFNLVDHSKQKIDNLDFVSDGHCTWTRDKRYMLTDTYSDNEGKRSLMLYDSVNGEVMLLGRFYAFPEGIKEEQPYWDDSALRCDLHPKWSFDERYVYFDSVHEGYRGLYRFNVETIWREGTF